MGLEEENSNDNLSPLDSRQSMQLFSEGMLQLVDELRILYTWKDELESDDHSGIEVIAAKRSYDDMIILRTEMIKNFLSDKRRNDSRYDEIAERLKNRIEETIPEHALSILGRVLSPQNKDKQAEGAS